MAVIGIFKAADKGFTGWVKTLAIDLSDVAITPTEKNEASLASHPDYQVSTKGIAVGAGWQHKAKASGKEYIRICIDDPMLEKPLYASLIAARDGNFNLIWSRAKRSS